MFFQKAASFSGGHDSESEQPASRSGKITRLVGLMIFAVSAMKWTPQNKITSASVFAALIAQAQRVADEVRHFLDLGT